MSKSIEFSDGGMFLLASGTSWTDACEWMTGLGFTSLDAFAESGEYTDTLTLRNELAEALDTNPVESEHTRDVLERLLDTIGVGDSEETVRVID